MMYKIHLYVYATWLSEAEDLLLIMTIATTWLQLPAHHGITKHTFSHALRLMPSAFMDGRSAKTMHGLLHQDTPSRSVGWQ